MARYVVLINWTDQGVRNAKDTVQRVAQARSAFQSMGVTVETVYWTLGDYDILCLFTAPDDAALAAALLQLAGQGNVRTKTLRDFDEGEMGAILGQLS